jgi:Mg-chelatase subunit ChlI
MPVEYALISQFIAFNFLYFADARATVRGWCPPWYTTYRFVLTFIVGASIVVSLVGRGQIEEASTKKNAIHRFVELRESQWRNLEKEEKERRKQMAADDEKKAKEEKGEAQVEKEENGDDKKKKKNNSKKSDKTGKKEDDGKEDEGK